MLDFQQLRVLELHSLLELDEKKKKGGLLVSQLFHIPPRPTSPCVSQPHGPCGTCSNGGWAMFVFLWGSTERLTRHTESEQMGSIVDIRRL
jgi:hypothetical protein